VPRCVALVFDTIRTAPDCCCAKSSASQLRLSAFVRHGENREDGRQALDVDSGERCGIVASYVVEIWSATSTHCGCVFSNRVLLAEMAREVRVGEAAVARGRASGEACRMAASAATHSRSSESAVLICVFCAEICPLNAERVVFFVH
jgi:hypothetical protein